MTRLLAVAILLAVASIASAQQAGRIYRVTIVTTGTLSLVAAETLPELARLGFVEGRNLSVTMRAAVPLDELTVVAREVATSRPDLIIAVSPVVVRAFAEATSTIPILMGFTNDPIAEGVVGSYTHPGGNITGQAMLQNEQTSKRVELLNEAVGKARHIALLKSPTESSAQQSEAARGAAERLGLRVSAETSSGSDDYEAPLSRLKIAGADAVVVASDPRFARDAELISRYAAAANLPIICEWDYMARAGCLLSYGPNNASLRRRTGQLAALLLKGTPPGDLPIEGPDRFELVINLKTAKALGLTIPPSLLVRADEVIE